jgi:hypothetical protein
LRTVEELQLAGIEVGDVNCVPGFLTYVQLKDPSGNLIEVAEYIRDPLIPA